MPGQQPQRLADLGEDALLAQIFPRLPDAPQALVGPGDDAAVVAASDGRVVATTDMLVEGRDFRREWSAAGDVGWKAAAQNLADIAAMGARPSGLLVALAAPADLAARWVLDFADGLAAACAGTGAGVVGGDLSGADQIVVCITALGDLQGRAPVLRSGARPGDVVAVCGRMGWSAAGLDLLRAGRSDVVPGLVEAHRRPRPPYEAGPAAAAAGATAMLDLSDGLLRDLGRLARASGVTIDLRTADGPPFAVRDEQDEHDSAWAPLYVAARALGNGEGREASDRVARWCLTGGEDHGLAACFPCGVDLPDGFTPVGTARAAVGGSPPVLLDGVAPGAVVGWDHFA